MERRIILLDHVSNGKRTIAGKTLVRNSKLYQILDAYIEKEKIPIIECPFLFDQKKIILLMLLGKDKICMRFFQK